MAYPMMDRMMRPEISAAVGLTGRQRFRRRPATPGMMMGAPGRPAGGMMGAPVNPGLVADLRARLGRQNSPPLADVRPPEFSLPGTSPMPMMEPPQTFAPPEPEGAKDDVDPNDPLGRKRPPFGQGPLPPMY